MRLYDNPVIIEAAIQYTAMRLPQKLVAHKLGVSVSTVRKILRAHKVRKPVSQTPRAIRTRRERARKKEQPSCA